MSIKEQIQIAFIQAAIGNLIEVKHQLEQAYNNGDIGYYHYLGLTKEIEEELNILSPIKIPTLFDQ